MHTENRKPHHHLSLSSHKTLHSSPTIIFRFREILFVDQGSPVKRLPKHSTSEARRPTSDKPSSASPNRRSYTLGAFKTLNGNPLFPSDVVAELQRKEVVGEDDENVSGIIFDSTSGMVLVASKRTSPSTRLPRSYGSTKG